MNYHINTKNIKQSVANLSSFFKTKGYAIPYNSLLEGFSQALYFKNWNTLEAICSSPKQIHQIKPHYQYLIEITIDMKKEKLMKLLEHAIEDAKSSIKIDKIRHENNDFHIELDVMKNGTNLLTALIILANKLKECGVIPTRMEHCRIQIEKESWMEYFKK